MFILARTHDIKCDFLCYLCIYFLTLVYKSRERIFVFFFLDLKCLKKKTYQCALHFASKVNSEFECYRFWCNF